MVSMPQYLLFCDAFLSPSSSVATDSTEARIGKGRWHFILERLDEPERFEAMDTEPNIHRDRLALLAVVRGLEALENGGSVRLITTSRYVDRGLRFGLPTWRDTDYHWENFGRLAPIRNADLWKRINAAMQFHDITSRLIHHDFLTASRLDHSEDWSGNQPLPTGVGYDSKGWGRLSLHSDTKYRGRRQNYRTESGHDHRGHSRHRHVVFFGVKQKRGEDRGYTIGKTDRIPFQSDTEALHEGVRIEMTNRRVQWWEMAASWIQTAGSAPRKRLALLPA